MSTTWKQVVLDVADAWREANDSTAKIPVGELPNKVKEGGENIDPEMTTLEGTLQEILEILPFKGFQNSGQYVWEKYEYNIITFTQLTSGTTITIKVESTTTDLSKVDESFFTGIKGTYATGGTAYPFEFVGNSQISLSGSNASFTYNPSTQVLTVASQISVICTWAADTATRFIDYVVSNDADAYPSGGELDGYWYKKTEKGFDFTDILGFSKCSITTFTFSSRTAVNNYLTHPFAGDIPKFVMIVAKEMVSATNDLYMTVALKNTDANNGVISVAQQFVYVVGVEQAVSKYNHQIGVNRNATNNIFIDTTGTYYAAGVEYYLIVAL